MRIIFFGSDPWFSPPILMALKKAGHEIELVVTKRGALEKFPPEADQPMAEKVQNAKLKIIQAQTTEDITREKLGNEIAAPRPAGLATGDLLTGIHPVETVFITGSQQEYVQRLADEPIPSDVCYLVGGGPDPVEGGALKVVRVGQIEIGDDE